MKQKRTITIEFDRVKITATHNSKRAVWCEVCREESEYLNQNDASDIVTALQQRGLTVNNRTLHFYRQNENEILVCLNSILAGSASADQPLIRTLIK